jgi:hypothetical protein
MDFNGMTCLRGSLAVMRMCIRFLNSVWAWDICRLSSRLWYMLRRLG